MKDKKIKKYNKIKVIKVKKDKNKNKEKEKSVSIIGLNSQFPQFSRDYLDDENKALKR